MPRRGSGRCFGKCQRPMPAFRPFVGEHGRSAARFRDVPRQRGCPEGGTRNGFGVKTCVPRPRLSWRWCSVMSARQTPSDAPARDHQLVERLRQRHDPGGEAADEHGGHAAGAPGTPGSARTGFNGLPIAGLFGDGRTLASPSKVFEDDIPGRSRIGNLNRGQHLDHVLALAFAAAAWKASSSPAAMSRCLIVNPTYRLGFITGPQSHYSTSAGSWTVRQWPQRRERLQCIENCRGTFAWKADVGTGDT
jgi:hypothetical protein